MSKQQRQIAADESGYGFTPSTSSGLPQLYLSQKGASVRIRIISKPYIFEESFTDPKTGAVKQKDKAGFIVIHKSVQPSRDGGKPRALREVKSFKVGMGVYMEISALARSLQWGDPREYDIVITRTEEFGKYYSVTPIGSKQTSEADRSLIKENAWTPESIFGTGVDYIHSIPDDADFDSLPPSDVLTP